VLQPCLSLATEVGIKCLAQLVEVRHHHKTTLDSVINPLNLSGLGILSWSINQSAM
jgi:hypothetical protein